MKTKEAVESVWPADAIGQFGLSLLCFDLVKQVPQIYLQHMYPPHLLSKASPARAALTNGMAKTKCLDELLS